MATHSVAPNISQPGHAKCEIKIRISTRKHNRLKRNVGKENNATTNRYLGESPRDVIRIRSTIIHSSEVIANESGCTTSSLVTE